MGCALSGTGLDPGKAGVDLSGTVPRSEAGRSELVASDSHPPLPLSEQQKDLIQQSWKVLHQDIARVGIIMFIRLFETHPECKDVFFLFRDIDDLQQLKMSKELQSHGLRVMSFIEKSVARLAQEDKLEQLAFELGRSHYRYNAPPKYYELLKIVNVTEEEENILIFGYVGMQFIAVVKPILKEKWTADVEEAWKGLFEYLTRMMKRGFHDAEQRNNVNQTNYIKRRAPSVLKASHNTV